MAASDILKYLYYQICTLLGVLKQSYCEETVRDGLRQCTKAVRNIKYQLKTVKTVGEKQHLLTQLAQIKSFRCQFKSLKKTGASCSTDPKKTVKHHVHWDDSANAFDGRIRTGVITNIKHKDPKEFLKDSFAVLRSTRHSADSFGCKKPIEFLRSQKHVVTPISTELDEFQERDIGWALNSITNLGININKFTPQLGSSYINLPTSIKKKQACVNVKNGDDACFAWAVTSALYAVDFRNHPDRISSYPQPSSVLNLKGIQFPMTMKQIPRFEKQNGVSVNVYILKKMSKGFTTLPTYLTKNKKDTHVNLLLIQDMYADEAEDESTTSARYHYVWIKDLSRLLSSQLSEHHAKKYFCDRCLHYFYTQEKLDIHYIDCKNQNDCRVRLPPEDQKDLKFKNYKNKEKVPFTIYADLESVLIEEDSGNKYQRHVPAAIGYYVKCSYDPSLSFYRSYRGEDCMSWFAREMSAFAEDVETVFLCPYNISMTSAQEAEFHKATHCHICEQPFKPEDVKVRDHFHLSPENNYRGAAHSGCNINYKDGVVIPVVFHNLSGYDAHFILENIANDLPDTLSSYLTEFPNLKSEFSELADDEFTLLTKKGEYPYDFMDSFAKFNIQSLPEQPHFYNRLEDKNISSKQFAHAQKVWNTFKIQNLGEYTDLYMKTDILLLADVFEQFRSSCHKTYGLDPANYYTLPGYTWDSMLFKTRQTLELLTDIDMLMFIERGIRGGLSQCSKRKSVANNKYLSNFDPSKPVKYLTYFDINNQYGWAMSQYLPYGGFEWVNSNIDVTNVSDTSSEGYLLEVDLEYPTHIHDLHRDLPFCPEHSAPPGCKNFKLLATLHNKTRYVIHYRALKQALKQGLKLTKIHRVLKFKQSPWLKSYIDLNTALRQTAKNEFEKNLFKLMNNAVFGKTMENIRKHSIVKLVNKWEGRYGAEALIAKPEFKAATIFNENLVAIELNKTEVFFNKPIYVGMSILDLAKTTIYDFHYDYMVPEFGNDCSVLYTDTDSLIYEITDKDVYEVMRRDCHTRFDTSDYPPDNRYNIPQVNKKVLGMMKDEFNGVPMELFVGLRSKMYMVKRAVDDDMALTKKIKGIKKSIIKNIITLEDYLECVDNFKNKYIRQNLIKSEKHAVFTMTQEKIALSPHDDKRYLIKGSYVTLPWGHYSIMEE
ncbi:uncharacterized protein LOC111692008 [Anoplophora glabripennis]|uniref:uncharacterized protein LOC111692008 n=1 Tax=Anoplophora glabripennis TaxID=217634 RepID=UPI000C770A82|nr:uncharacterized protein LOC111692008 [Anoplophora glabripennis]